MSFGALCKHCTRTKCHDAPTKQLPARLACVACEGKGCDGCNGNGYTLIDRCPHRIVTRDVWQALRFARRADKGALPVAGGLLNQTQSFLEAWELIDADRAVWRAHQLNKK